MVREMVPPEKLLIMDLKEGWAPLCQFLHVPIPDEPLPRANDADAANRAAEEITSRVFQIWGTGLAVGLGTIAVAGLGVWRSWKIR